MKPNPTNTLLPRLFEYDNTTHKRRNCRRFDRMG